MLSKKDLYTRVVDPERYLPLIWLLRDQDNDLSHDGIREYLRLLRDDHAALLAQIRLIMAESGTDRPDLAKALARNRVRFASVLCRIEFRLWLRSIGLGRREAIVKELLMLLESVKALHLRAAFLCESAVWGV